MHRQATIKLLARSLVVLFLAFLTTAPSCDEIIKDFFDLSSSRTIKELSESSPEEQRTAAAALLTLEATARESSRSMTVEAQATVLALLPPSPSSGQVTTIPLPTHTATPTPTSPNTPTPASTPTRTSAPTSTPTVSPTATHTPTPTSTPTPATTIFYTDPADDCTEYTSGNKTSCSPGQDIYQAEFSIDNSNNVLTIRVVFFATPTGSFLVRYTTPLGTGNNVTGVTTYLGVENGDFFEWDNACNRKRGPANASCKIMGKEMTITVPVEGFGQQPSGTVHLRAFMTDFGNPNHNRPVDLAPYHQETISVTGRKGAFTVNIGRRYDKEP